VLLLVLVGAPLLGSVLQRVVAHTMPASKYRQALHTLLPSFGGGSSFLAAWLLLIQTDWQVVVGGWSPVSLTGLPLALASFAPACGLIITWVAVYLSNLVLVAPAGRSLSPAGYALFTAALLLVAFANNFITLLVGLGLVDLLMFCYRLLRGEMGDDARAFWLGLIFNSTAVLLLVMLAAVHASAGGSLHLPIMRISSSVAPVLALVAALRLGLIPFHLPINAQVGPMFIADALGVFLLLMRLPQLGVVALPAWFYALVVVSALLCLLLRDPGAPHRFVNTASAYLVALSAVLAVPGAVAASASAWVLGITLLDPSVPGPARPRWLTSVLRLMGAACLIGLPFTVGFVGYAGILPLWINQGVAGWLLGIGWVAATAVLVDALIGQISAPSPDSSAASLWRWVASRLILLAPVLISSIAPALIGAGTWGELLDRGGIADGMLRLAPALLFGVSLRRLQARWPAGWSSLRARVSPALSLSWAHDLMAGAMQRMRRPFQSVFTLLEGDGILSWAAIVALVLILLSRTEGP